MATAFSDHSTMLSCLSNLCSLEPEDHLFSDLLQDKPEDQSLCHNCDECAKATSKCKDCDEMLCDKCVRAHIRVKLTKDHFIVPLDDPQTSPAFNNPPSTASSGSPPNSCLLNGNTFCEAHITETVRFYCDICSIPICGECTVLDHRGHTIIYFRDAVDGARSSTQRLLADSQKGAQSTKECIDLGQRMMESLNLRSHSIARDIRAVIRKIQLALDDRERELINKLEKLRLMKQKALQQQIDGFRSLLSGYTHTTEMLSDVLEAGSSFELLTVKDAAFCELKRLRSIRSSIPPLDDELIFTPPDGSLMLAISNIGDVSLPVLAQPNSIGEGIIRNVCSTRQPSFTLNKNHSLDEISAITPDTIPPFLGPIVENALPSMEDDKLSSVWGTPLPFRPKIDIGLPSTVLTRNNRATPLAPIGGPIGCSSNRSTYRKNYTSAGRPKLVIGSEGEKDGQLCRPWGVCCDAEGNIIVADRSNNRIQIFTSEGVFLRKFGSYGSEPGYFDRPAGVATDPQGRIVVTDKDNHRIQVFTNTGQFVFTFGEKGSKIGQFNYPWDIAVDSKGRIVVSDTRNHRIQMFAKDGTFLCKYGFENTANMVKHFDSPRGVCFSSKGCVIVTDFNNHRLVVIDPNFRNARFLGTEGSLVKQFLRPQGVAIDQDGNIIVADSRNNRIQVFEPNGSFLWQFGTAGKEVGQLDRPSGVCLTPDGKIVVVDFGNNRIQVF